jgi:GT2 family glycosyltransferase
VLDCDVAVEILPFPPTSGGYALVLVRFFGEPIGLITGTVPADGLEPRALAAAIAERLEPELRERFEECGLTWAGELPLAGLDPPATPAFVRSRDAVLSSGPGMTIVVCTRDRPDSLRLLLKSLAAQRYPRAHVLVVDNAPSDDRTRRLVAKAADETDVEYVVEPRPGLSWARNRALEVAQDEVLAWADDDAVCDPWWATELARAFVDVPAAGAVTGVVVPSELATQSQVWYEQYCGVGRGRGLERIVFAPGSRDHDPLYPMPIFGSGNNMAFRRRALEQIGGFDRWLGAGTATQSGEDIAALSSVMLEGWSLVYQPSAIVRHAHRRAYADLRRLQVGYGRGMGAFYASLIAHRPSTAVDMLRLVPRAARDQLSRRGRRLGEMDDGVRRDLLRAFRVGLLQGPFIYSGSWGWGIATRRS